MVYYSCLRAQCMLWEAGGAMETDAQTYCRETAQRESMVHGVPPEKELRAMEASSPQASVS